VSLTVVLRISAAAHMTMTGKIEPFCAQNQTGHRIRLALQYQTLAASSKRELRESRVCRWPRVDRSHR